MGRFALMMVVVPPTGAGVEQRAVGCCGVEVGSGAMAAEVGACERRSLDEFGEVVDCIGGSVGRC